MTPKPQTNTLDEIKNSHTMKLVPLSQRELFWHELKPKLQALIAEARADELMKLEEYTRQGRGTIAWEMDDLETYRTDRLKKLIGGEK